MASGLIPADSRAEHRGLAYWMERVLKELENVRSSPDADAVHDLRVAIRRCRSVAAVMEEVDPDPAWPEMRKGARKLFHRLGELRDTQVLAEWTKTFSSEGDPVREILLTAFAKNEEDFRGSALRAVEKFDQKHWKHLEETLAARSRRVPPDCLAAECLALERLEAAKHLHAAALRTEQPEPWHELRIGIKRFRYTVESLLPTRYEAWSENLKRLQDLLGEVHDFDVLSATIENIAAHAPEESREHWRERIASERHAHLETYRQLTLGKTSLWHEWREGLAQGERLDRAAQARLRVTARAMDRRPPRTSQVARIAMRLFDSFRRVHVGMPFGDPELRKVMCAAARLHSIGASLDSRAPSKAARKFLRDMAPPPGWSKLRWKLLAQIVRYHRGGEPKAKHKSYARLDETQQQTIRALAGILRLARALRKSKVQSTVGMGVEKSVDALILRIPGLEISESVAARLAAGKHLLETAVNRPVIIKSAPAVPKVVEMARAEPELPFHAAASD
jgi:CHAD domain-containing protein